MYNVSLKIDENCLKNVTTAYDVVRGWCNVMQQQQSVRCRGEMLFYQELATVAV